MTEKDLDIAIEKCERIMEMDTRTMQNPVSDNGWIFEKVYDLLEFLRQFQFETGGMDDTISRQAAIDALDVLCQEHRYKIPGKAETYSQYNEAWQDALDRAEGAIGDLPSAQPEQRWIPFSERRPWEGQQILVCAEDGVMWMTVFRSCIGFSGAWLPLPEPYKEKP